MCNLGEDIGGLFVNTIDGDIVPVSILMCNESEYLSTLRSMDSETYMSISTRDLKIIIDAFNCLPDETSLNLILNTPTRSYHQIKLKAPAIYEYLIGFTIKDILKLSRNAHFLGIDKLWKFCCAFSAVILVS